MPVRSRRAPFLLLKKFTPSCLLPEDRDDDAAPARGGRGGGARFVYPFTMALIGYRASPNDLVTRKYTYAHVYPSRGVVE